ncbi:histidine ammonia-lyase [Chromobacterium vaccinii]|uniref:histidine ammonia-lyase n=1 Tax=Chromobacterium vaccinii TaxID=1108595 RepID=UPI000617C07C|nr:histidine ammonia-lyase [Chromobacterium vaccinii]
MENHILSLDRYTLIQLRDIVEQRQRLELSPEVASRIEAGAEFVQRRARHDEYIYGVNTGFGSLCETRVKPEQVEALQYNHIVSHACGVGEPVSERCSRLVLLIKLLTFRSGHTGVSLQTVQRLIDYWNHGVIPAIPKKGTVGASGDLAPLAHMSLPLLGLGQVYMDGKVVPARAAMDRYDWTPLHLKAKEGLALTNGVQYINAIASECLLDMGEMLAAADLIAALSIQAFSGSQTFYHARYHETSHHMERRRVAARLRSLLQGSNHHQLSTCNQSKQDPYSFRCIPQVHGAVLQVYDNALRIIEDEINGVSDNPLFFPEEDLILFGGNLHGESTAMQMDFLCVAASELSNISERRTYQLLSGQRGLPSFLIREPGINSGMMVPQYTSAALVNQSKALCFPASADTIPTCQLQEDHVSMGGTSGYKLQEILDNTRIVLSIELMTAAQAAELNQELTLSGVTEDLLKQFRTVVAHLGDDRVMSDDIDASTRFVSDHLRLWFETHGAV